MSTTINLGTITTGKISLFKVVANSSQPVVLSYTYSGGRLPPGLSVAVDGGINGKCGNNVFELDNGLTTFDNQTTTIDRRYVFSVTATGQFGNVSSEQTFSIFVVKNTNNEIANVYGQIFVDKIQRDQFTNFVTNNKIFPNDALYRPYDINFDTRFPKFLFLAGVHLKFLYQLQSYLQNNTYDFELKFGDYKIAKAKDNIGNVLYEVVYAELIDPKATANKSIEFNHQLPTILSQIRADSLELLSDLSLSIPPLETSKVYNNDVINMQHEIKENTEVENFSYLPRWMQSYQDDNQVLGYKLVLPLKYVQPGQGDKVLYRIKNENNYDIKTLHAFFDRWMFDNNLGTRFDYNKILLHTGDGSTTIFEAPYKITKPQQVVVKINNEITTAYKILFPVTADISSITSDNILLSADINQPTQTSIVFDSAPSNGLPISIQLKETTFGKKVVTTFDVATNITTFDDNGTRFIGEEVTFDKKNPTDAQIMFNKKSILDNITTVSKQRKLVRSL